MTNIDLETLVTVTGGSTQTNQLIQSQLTQLTTSLSQAQQPQQSQTTQLAMGFALGTLLRR